MQLELDFGVCALDDYDEDDHPQIQTDSPGVDGSEGTQPAERLMPSGFYSRLLDPEKGPKGEVGLGAPVLVITAGDRRYTIPLNDPRDVGKVPKLRKGGSMVAGGAGEHRSFLVVDGEDPSGAKNAGSITISASYSKGGKKKSLGLAFNVRDSGNEEISIVHGEGQRFTMSAKGSRGITLSNAKGDAYAEIGDDGIVLAGESKVQGALTVGSQLGGLPVPIWPKLMDYLQTLEAALLAHVGSIGPNPIVVPTPIATVAKAIESQHLKAT